MNNQKGFANIVLIVLVVILAGAVGYFTLVKKSPTPTNETPSTNNLPAQQTPPANTTQTPPPSSQTNKPGWKIYVGAGFEVQYPENTYALVELPKEDPMYVLLSIKLISADRISKIGKPECRHPVTNSVMVCSAVWESGIAFIILNDSFQNVVSEIVGTVINVTVGGKQGIQHNIEEERGFGTDDYFVSLGQNKTLVIQRFYGPDGFPQQTLFNQVLATLVIK